MLSRNRTEEYEFIQMRISHSKEIKVSFRSAFDYLLTKEAGKRVIFIDPFVLAKQDGFFGIEADLGNTILVPTNIQESTKDIESLDSLVVALESHGIGRRGDLICAIGGGALLDAVSFAASVFRRGVNVVKIPTTLLGIVDASIGIKTGVNFRGQRNRIGSYHFDYEVVIDPSLLKGLRSSAMRHGLGEIFKIAVIKSYPLFDMLTAYRSSLELVDFYSTQPGHSIIASCIQLMLEELHDNPREDQLMRCVDFGHTFSPLVEMASLNRRNVKSLPHGYAVAYDCVLSSTISYNRHLLSSCDYEQILDLFTGFDFDFSNEIYLDTNLLWASLLEITKHRGGNQNLPVPTAIGSFIFIQDLTFDELEFSSNFLRQRIS